MQKLGKLLLFLVTVSIGLVSSAHTGRWKKWEIERNEKVLNSQLYHALPSDHVLKALQVSQLLKVQLKPDQVHVLQNKLATQIKSHFIQPETGIVSFYIHPQAISLFPFLFKQSEVVQVQVDPTTSPRSFFLPGEKELILKVSLPQKIAGAIRTVYPLQMERALAISEMLSEITAAQKESQGFEFLPEVMGIYDSTPGSPFGFLVRLIPEKINSGTSTLVPLTAYVAAGPNGERSLFETDADLMGMKPDTFAREKLLPAMVKSFDLAARHGIALEDHQQNMLFELDKNNRFTGLVYHRDMDGARVDFGVRKRQGLSTEFLEKVSNSDWVFDLENMRKLNESVIVPRGRPPYWSGIIERAFQTYLIGSSIHLIEHSIRRIQGKKLNLKIDAEINLKSLSVRSVGHACETLFQ